MDVKLSECGLSLLANKKAVEVSLNGFREFLLEA
jgi:hypothetical protein